MKESVQVLCKAMAIDAQLQINSMPGKDTPINIFFQNHNNENCI